MIIISYFTKNTPYERVMQSRLLPSLVFWKLPYNIQGVPDLGSWQKNTSFKAQFIYDMLLKHKQDVCFIDADATILKYPHLLFEIPEDYTLAAHKLDWNLLWRKQQGNSKREFLSGTMVFKYNDLGLKLAQRYVEECNKSTNWEQKILQNIIEYNPIYKLYELPPEYCCIIMRDGKIPTWYCKNPVILHWQASRVYKNKKQ